MEEKAREISKQILTQRGGYAIFDEENRAVLIFDGENLWTSKIIFILDSEGWSCSENGIRGPWKDLKGPGWADLPAFNLSGNLGL